jgi:hypothetical protein
MAICGVVVGYSFDHDYRCGRLALATYTFIESIKLKNSTRFGSATVIPLKDWYWGVP